MDRGSYLAEILNYLCLRLDRAVEIFGRVLAACAHLFEGRRIDVSRKSRCVDMDIAAARGDQAVYDLTFDCDHIGHERVDGGVNRGGRLVIEALRNAVGTDQ